MFQNQAAVDKFCFGRVFRQAFLETARVSLVTNAFRSCGLWPVCAEAVDYTKALPATTFCIDENPRGEKASTAALTTSDTQGKVTETVTMVSDQLKSGYYTSLLQSESVPLEGDMNEFSLDINSNTDQQVRIFPTIDMGDISHSSCPDQPGASMQNRARASDPSETARSGDANSLTPTSKIYMGLPAAESRCCDVLAFLESKLTPEERSLYRKRYESNRFYGEGLYSAWKALRDEIQKEVKARKTAIMAYCEENSSSKLARKELFRLPQRQTAPPNPKRKRFPPNLTSDEALTQSEAVVRNIGETNRRKQQHEDVRRLKLMDGSKGKRKEKSEQPSCSKRDQNVFTSASADRCRGCRGIFVGGAGEPRWIACDRCDTWYHLRCTSLDDNLSQAEVESLTWECVICKA